MTIYDPERGWTTPENEWPGDEPEPEKPHPKTGWPGAAAPTCSAWTMKNGRYMYRVQSGDTISGLAKTYLGMYERWHEIWAEQSPDVRATRSADTIYVGELLNMPQEAIDQAKAMGCTGDPVHPGVAHPVAPSSSDDAKTNKMLLAAAGVAAGAALIWWAS